ncbi:GIY-YIG nuclease family protein [Paracoccus sp. S-4012]|uniref:GIY-YIG nuclease family protein n=1 Tax=Paracoccus sp. S-4012 TaxID=2665648 RepID=UPI0012B0E3AD|nr:GIY-YIG nuclease family protein [Paracoccus sp. S-4012]MRX51641.1 GIY-YIG nuclease family protein [Paracoccus sp. S-4012]
MPHAHDNSIIISGEALPVIDMPIHDHWREAADRRGFDITARVADRYALALTCRQCGKLSRTRLFVLMHHQPRCSHCIEAAWRQEAAAAGLTFQRRDPASTAYAWYRLPCGHDARRQIGLITRVAAGETGLRCATCQEAVEAAEARAVGWELVGPDPAGDTNYREYRHISCSHQQRIARGNVKSQRFDCAGCGVTWTAAPSFIYLFRVLLPSGMRVLKLGFSKNPRSRLQHQLLGDGDLACHVLRVVAMPSGHDAIRTEKGLHTSLRRRFPDAVIDAKDFAGALTVVTEVYAEWLEAEIQQLLDGIEDDSDDDGA